MTDYVFILGKNWLLSVAELLVYLNDQGLQCRIKDHSNMAVIVDIPQKLSDEQLFDIQSSLGGCFKTGRVLGEYDIRLAMKAFPERGTPDKDSREKIQRCEWIKTAWPRPDSAHIKFGVSTYVSSDGLHVDARKMTLAINEYVKEHLLQLGARKASYYIYNEPDRRRPERANTALWPQTISQHALLRPPNAEILVALTKHRMYVGKTVAVYDSVFQQYRDEERPYVEVATSTSPKLCRALLNFAGARSGDTVLDPFCGTGTVLMEAALLDMKCLGIDIDKNAVSGTINNLKWLGAQLKSPIEFNIIHGDARRASDILKRHVDAIAFEPDLGPTYDTPPSQSDAMRSVVELTNLYQEALQSLAKCLRPHGRVGMTIPLVNTQQEAVSVDLAQMLDGTGLHVVRMIPAESLATSLHRGQPTRLLPDRERIPERKRGQIVQREVIMLKRD